MVTLNRAPLSVSFFQMAALTAPSRTSWTGLFLGGVMFSVVLLLDIGANADDRAPARSNLQVDSLPRIGGVESMGRPIPEAAGVPLPNPAMITYFITANQTAGESTVGSNNTSALVHKCRGVVAGGCGSHSWIDGGGQGAPYIRYGQFRRLAFKFSQAGSPAT